MKQVGLEGHDLTEDRVNDSMFCTRTRLPEVGLLS